MCLCGLIACRPTPVPKPRGYFRISLPPHSYQTFSQSQQYPYFFEYSTAATISMRTEIDEKYWIDICYSQLNAKIHCSYKPVENKLRELSDDAQRFVFNHANMANAIPEHGYENAVTHVYGVLYELEGNTASPIQFYLTDSINNFFRAALYFDCIPNQDSLAPVIDYINEDIIHLIETFQWQSTYD